MPNKYSHAHVLSHYEAHGLTQFDGARIPQPRPQHATSSTGQSYNSNSTSQLARLSIGRPPSSTGRIRLRPCSPPPLPSPEPYPSSPHQRTDTDFTVVTEIHSSNGAPPSLEVTKNDRRHSYMQEELGGTSEQLTLSPLKNVSRQSIDEQKRASAQILLHRLGARANDRTHVKLEGHDARGLHWPDPSHSTQRRLSHETAIFSPESPSNTSSSTMDRQLLIEASGCFRHPPSPPLTPEHRQSFSLDTFLDGVQPPSTVMAAELSLRTPSPSFGRSSVSSQSISASTRPSTMSQPPSQINELKHSTEPTLRRSTCSLPASTHSYSLTDIVPHPHDPSNFRASLSCPTIAPPLDELVDTEDADLFGNPFFGMDLESLPKLSAEFGSVDIPTGLPPDLDYDGLSWKDPKFGEEGPTDAFSLSSRSASTRASSFDSAAPPPIGLNRFNGTPLDRSRPESPPAVPDMEQTELRKPARKSFFSMFRTDTQKRVSASYQTITPSPQTARTSDLSVSTSSISAQARSGKDPRPPVKTSVAAAKPHRASRVDAPPLGKSSIMSSPAAPSAGPTVVRTAPGAVAPPTTAFRQNGPAPKTLVKVPSRILSDGPAPFAEGAPLSRGKSVGPSVVESRRPRTAAEATAQRRKSCFNTDTLERTFGGREARKRERRGSVVVPGMM